MGATTYAAETPQTAVSIEDGGRTSISITDVTPREEQEDETQSDYAVGGLLAHPNPDR